MTAALTRPVSPFAAATLAPLPLLVLAAVAGGVWALLALLYMTLLRFTLDALVATAGPGAAPGAEFPAAERLSKALAVAHFPLLALGVAAVSGTTGLGFWDGLAAFLAFGMYFGQVSTSNAHELIHRTDRLQSSLGKWVLISILYGHHVTAHLKVHHRFVATPDDPSTAPLGQGFWSFLPRAWVGAFVAGWEIEKSAAAIAGRPLPWWRHPYAEYVAGGAAFALAFTLAFGASGLVAYLMLAGYAQLQLLLSDYVQHYGLRRRRVGDDGWEPVAPWHSWNGTHWFSGGLMLNAPRHSEHHTNPAVPYPELGLPPSLEGPRLPHSLPTMGAIALVPPLWRRVMDRRAAGWQARIDEGRLRRSPRLEPLGREGAVPPDRAAGAGDAAPEARGGVGEPAEAGATLARVARLAAAGAAASADAAPGAELAAGAAGAAPPDTVAGRLRLSLAARRDPRAAVDAPAADAAAATEATPDTSAAESPAAGPPANGGAPVRDDEGLAIRLAELSRRAVARAAEDDPGEAPQPSARFMRSSALFQPGAEDAPPGGPAGPDGAHPGPGAVPPPPRPDGHAEGAAETDVEAAVAALLKTSRKETRRRRARFPAIEADIEEPQVSPQERAREIAEAGRLAALALAAVMRGAPPDPAGEPLRD